MTGLYSLLDYNESMNLNKDFSAILTTKINTVKDHHDKNPFR